MERESPVKWLTLSALAGAPCTIIVIVALRAR